MTLSGLSALDRDEPVCHVNHFEADAYARWAGKRLPLEAEWERMAMDSPVEGNFADSGHFHPIPADGGTDQTTRALQVFGDPRDLEKLFAVLARNTASEVTIEELVGAEGRENDGRWVVFGPVTDKLYGADPVNYAKYCLTNCFIYLN